MDFNLTREQLEVRQKARQYAATEVAPWAATIDKLQTTPTQVLDSFRRSGYLGAALNSSCGGGGLDPISYGLINEEIGKACSSLRSLMTVHNMSAQAVAKFGTDEQRELLLYSLCSGEKIIAFALTETIGSSAIQRLGTQIRKKGAGYVLTGTKRWVTYGQVADLYLVFAELESQSVALLVERAWEGVDVKPVDDMLGTRGSMLAHLEFRDIYVPKSYLLGAPGMGLKFIANSALDYGRFSVAWGSTGIIQACLDSSVSYASLARSGGERLRDHQLIRRQLTDMLASYTASRSLCLRSACLRANGDPSAVMETSLAKYYASEAAIRASEEAVRLHGANGCSSDYPVSRYLRDAMVMGNIEGTREIHQLSLASYACQRPYLN